MHAHRNPWPADRSDPALRDYIETKLARLLRHFDQPLEVRTNAASASTSLSKKAEATVNVSGRTIHADANAVDMYAAIDRCRRQARPLLVKHKEKLVDQYHGAGQRGDAG